ncbi:ImmA/IrrE family metallo-endopeptidase [Paracoccus versutus]|uniref:ImmA/IrrE family metallo-endopeptidase n=1 Tax=Paracoccus versutus TaxID=34007 RepID=UPI000E274956|nr:ImmA/IrrE family metallo-endopeptidase [Paracoccus versutus]WGR57417.1 ImmA/IrrE family metallo-endopeptidase [Paracoccus versutus]
MRRPRPTGFSSKLPTMNSSALDTPERVLSYCQEMGLITEFGSVDIQRLILNDDNLTLKFEDLADKDAYIMHAGGASYIIGINSKHPKNRQRFSMAHEYAHYQLHRNQITEFPEGERILHRDGNSIPIEWQANRFAAKILMPKTAVESAMIKSDGRIVEAALALKVSVAALQFRQEELSRDTA